jgi:hypothetical protein
VSPGKRTCVESKRRVLAPLGAGLFLVLHIIRRQVKSCRIARSGSGSQDGSQLISPCPRRSNTCAREADA